MNKKPTNNLYRLIYLLFFLFTTNLYSQIHVISDVIYSHVWNKIQIDNRLVLDTIELKKHADFHILPPSDYVKNYSIFPFETYKHSLKIKCFPKKKKKEKLSFDYLLKDPEPINIYAFGLPKNGKYEFTNGIHRIRFRFHHLQPYYLPVRYPKLMDVYFNTGQNFMSVHLKNLDSVIYQFQPDSILVTNFVNPFKNFRYKSSDTVRVVLIYPSNPDTSKWCHRKDRNVILFNNENLKTGDTLLIKKQKCLFLDFNFDGTQNNVSIQSLEYDKVIREPYYSGSRNNQIDFTNEYGLFYIEYGGDGGFGSKLFYLEK